VGDQSVGQWPTGSIRPIGLQRAEEAQRGLADPVFPFTITGRDRLTADCQPDVTVSTEVLSGRVIVRILRREPSLPDDLDLEGGRADPTS
jgi:hypothetical protein